MFCPEVIGAVPPPLHAGSIVEIFVEISHENISALSYLFKTASRQHKIKRGALGGTRTRKPGRKFGITRKPELKIGKTRKPANVKSKIPKNTLCSKNIHLPKAGFIIF